MSAEEELREEYVADYDCLMEGVIFMSGLEAQVISRHDMSPLISHWETHPEDKLAHVYRPSDGSTVLCRRSGLEAIRRIAFRLIASSPRGEDFSIEEVESIISHHVLQVAIDGVSDDSGLVAIFKTYLRLAEASHKELTYHFACILVSAEKPSAIQLGPVRFTRGAHYKAYLRERASQATAEADALSRFDALAQKHGWVATISIPACGQKVSRRRAEKTIEIAIALLKLIIGTHDSRAMRLPHSSPAEQHKTYFLVEEDGQLTWKGQGNKLESALLADNWFDHIPDHTLEYVGVLLDKLPLAKRGEVADRIIDGIQWFSDASYEVASGVRIAKWIAALERLTTLDKFSTHTFCKRVSLLASDLNEHSVEETYNRAKLAYQLRCDVMHGARSQNDRHFTQGAMLVHDLARMALLRSLEVHAVLDMSGKANASRLYDFFCEQERRFHQVFAKIVTQSKALKGTASAVPSHPRRIPRL